MIIKRNTKKLIPSIILISLLAFSTVINKIDILNFKYDIYEYLMTLDPGFSSARNMSEEGAPEYQSEFFKSISIFKNSNQILRNAINKEDDTLINIKIIVKFKHLKKLNSDRITALKNGYLDSPKEVSAKILHAGNVYKAKLRLKGDLSDHWKSRYRFSLKVNLNKNETINGMNSFTIQKPRTRQYPFDQAFQSSLRKVGNLSAKHHFAKISFNDQNWGKMLVEESMSSEYLEKFNKKESIIFKFSNDLYWKNYKKNNIKNTNAKILKTSAYRLSNSAIFGSIYQPKKYLAVPHFRRIYTYVMEARLSKNHAHLYSKKEHLKLLISAFAWNSFHTLMDNNSKYYFNPYTLKLSPISTDQQAFSKFNSNVLDLLNNTKLPLNYYQILSDLTKIQFTQTVKASLKNLKGIEKELNTFQNIFPLDKRKKSASLLYNINKFIEKEEDIFASLSSIKDKVGEDGLKVNISIDQANNLPAHLGVRHYDNGEIKIFNLLPYPVKVEKIIINNLDTSINGFFVPGYTDNNFKPLKLKTNSIGIYDGKIKVISSFKGANRTTIAAPTLISKNIFNPFLNSTEMNFPFISGNSVDQWKIKKGDYEVTSPVIIHGHLSIEPGVNISFSNNSYMIIKGTLMVNGTSEEKVNFFAKDESWKGLYLLSDNNSSTIKNLTLKNTTALKDGILNLTSGFTIYSSNIKIKNLFISDSIAEDSINIVNSSIDINNIQIFNASSDALDCDFCLGKIKNSKVLSANGDGFDFSGSIIDLEKISIKKVKDKAISAGEKSKISIILSDFNNIGVGVASKDESNVELNNVTIKNYALFGATTYQKKKIFKRRSVLNIQNSVISGVHPFKRQNGTYLIVDGLEVEETPMNVENLYLKGIMKK
jgi:hypothetical protein